MDQGSLTASRRLFGTDGVRGRVGEALDAELAVALGRAAAAETGVERPQVVIVRDTRESGPMLESALSAGIAAGGGDAYLAGVLPTPAASILVRRHGLDLAAVVSASHNPWQDNGIKFFGADGIKLDDAVEARIEERLSAPGELATASGTAVGRIRALEGALDDYLRELASKFEIDLRGRRVLLDCANGATYRAAPAAFERLGAGVATVADEPDGRNINQGCGAMHPERLAHEIREAGAEIGFAFDGDGDRVLAVDRRGRIRDGDEIVALIATQLRRAGRLEGGVVVTVMTNFGFHTAMADAGIEVATTKVGDRYVIEELRNRDWEVGGEQSGHVIWMEFTPTGDGIAAALLLERALEGGDLADASPFEKLPQRLVNVELESREALDGAAGLWEAVEDQQAALEGRGRVLVRPSGTEPVARIMVEAPSIEECDAIIERLTEVARRELAQAG
jgi:phosphoglucosamine mutase